MAILQYYCPKHHTTKRLTRLDKFVDYPDWGDKVVKKASFIHVTPICQICRKKMVRLHGAMPKKNKKRKV